MTATATVRVTNIAPQATRDQMHKLFGFIGKIDDIRLYPTVRDVAVPVLSRVSFVRFSDAHLTDVALHMTNTVFIDRALVVMPHHGAIPDELAALETLRRDNGLIGTLNDGELPAHVTNVVEGAYYITRDPSFAENGVPDYPDLACTLEYGEVEEIRRTIVVGNLPPDTETSKLVKFMATAGEVKYARMCGQSTDETRACLLEFSEQTAILPAMKMAGTTFRGRALTMAHSRVPILKPQIKTNEMAQREIEEAMRRAQEQQTLMTANVQPQVPYLEPKRRSRSRSRSHRLSSRSDSYRSKRRSRSRERGRRSRSRDRKRSRSRDRKRSRSRERKRSRSRDRKRSRSRERKRSRSRDRKRSRSRDGKYSRSRDKKRSRSRDRRERGKLRRSRSKEKRSHSSRDKRESLAYSRDDVVSGDAVAAPVGDIDQCGSKSGADHAATRRSSRSRSPPSTAHRKQARRSRSRSRGHRKSRSPTASAKRYSRSSAEPRKSERRSSHERREKSGATDRRVVRDYDEEEQGYDDQVAGADSPQDSPPPAKASRHSRSLAASKSRADDMDMSD